MRGIANTLDSLGYAHHHVGDHEQAIGCYRQALVTVRETGHRCAEGETLIRLGDSHCSAGDLAAAATPGVRR